MALTPDGGAQAETSAGMTAEEQAAMAALNAEMEAAAASKSAVMTAEEQAAMAALNAEMEAAAAASAMPPPSPEGNQLEAPAAAAPLPPTSPKMSISPKIAQIGSRGSRTRLEFLHKRQLHRDSVEVVAVAAVPHECCVSAA